MKLVKSTALFSLFLGLFGLLPSLSEAQPRPARKICHVKPFMDCRANCRGKAWASAANHCKWLGNRRNRCEANYDTAYRACAILLKGRTACLKKALADHTACNAYIGDWYYKRLSVNNDVRSYCSKTCPKWAGKCVNACVARVRGACNKWWGRINTASNLCYKKCRKRHCDL